MNVEVDPNQKSDRLEWSTARYHAHYSPQCGFELQVQWMVSTGGILGELVGSLQPGTMLTVVLSMVLSYNFIGWFLLVDD